MRTRSIVIWTAVAVVGAVVVGRHRAGARRADLGRLADLRRGRVVRDRVPLLRALHRRARCSRSTANRATPAERLDNGIDFQPTDRRVLFGHHFAAIAGAGPLVGPVLAAQMGYLPGTIWIIVGVIFAGAVQDMVDPVLLDAPRRQVARADGARRDRAGRRRGGADRGLRDHDHPARGPRARGRQRARAVAVGDVLAGDDDPDRAVHGLLPARAAAGPRAGDDGDRRDAAARRDRARRRRRRLEPRRRVHALARDARAVPRSATASSRRCCRCGCCSRRATTSRRS